MRQLHNAIAFDQRLRHAQEVCRTRPMKVVACIGQGGTSCCTCGMSACTQCLSNNTSETPLLSSPSWSKTNQRRYSDSQSFMPIRPAMINRTWTSSACPPDRRTARLLLRPLRVCQRLWLCARLGFPTTLPAGAGVLRLGCCGSGAAHSALADSCDVSREDACKHSARSGGGLKRTISRARARRFPANICSMPVASLRIAVKAVQTALWLTHLSGSKRNML